MRRAFLYDEEDLARVDALLKDFGYDEAARMIVLGGLHIDGRLQGVQRAHLDVIEHALKKPVIAPVIPALGQRYEDAGKPDMFDSVTFPRNAMATQRTLVVTEINPGDRNGREVRGVISRPHTNGHKIEYSTTMEMFSDNWRPVATAVST